MASDEEPTSRQDAVLLMGGQSSRMQTDKAFLRLPSGTALFVHQLAVLDSALPPESRIFLSLRDTNQAQRAEAELATSSLSTSTRARIFPIFDAPPFCDIGPSGGILAAATAAKTTLHGTARQCLLVLAVDFVCVSTEALQHLLKSLSGPVVCARHASDGAPEPVLSVWTLAALEELARRCSLPPGERRTGPCATAKALWKDNGGMSVGAGLCELPGGDEVLRSVNTPEEWAAVARLLERASA